MTRNPAKTDALAAALAAIAKLTTEAEMRLVSTGLRARWREVQAGTNLAALSTLHIGDTVTFAARGRTHTGTIQKMNTRTVTVLVPNPSMPFPTSWRVSPGLLRRNPSI